MIRHKSIILAALLAAVFPMAGAQIPRRAPEFAIALPNGQQTLLSQYRGKVVALEFLLTTCPHCQRATVVLGKLYSDLGPRGFQPLGAAINDMAMMLLPDYIKQTQANYPVGVGNRDAVTEFLQHPPMMRMLMPQLVFIDRKGMIRAQYAGDDKFFQDEEKNMRAMIEMLLKEPAGPEPRNAGAAKKPARSASSK